MTGNKTIKTILITGINGSLGSLLAKSLSKEYNVIGLEYSLNNLSRIEHLGLKIYSSEHGIDENMFIQEHIDTIIHTATFYASENEEVQKLAKSNLFIPFELLDKAIKNSCSLFINTDTVINRFTNIYALTKHQFAEWLYIRRKEIKIVNMQLEHFYGPGCSNSNFITNMIERLRNNETSIDLTLGEQKRDFVFINDVVDAYETVILKSNKIVGDFTTFQVGTGNLISINEVMTYLKKILNATTILNFGAIPYRENELMQSESDNKKLIELGWKVNYSIQQGLKESIKEN